MVEVDEEYGYRMKNVRNLFLQGLAFVYFIAFLSIYIQADGEYVLDVGGRSNNKLFEQDYMEAMEFNLSRLN